MTSPSRITLRIRRKSNSKHRVSPPTSPRDEDSNARRESEPDLYSDPERQPSHVDKGEAKLAVELKEYLDDAEGKPKPLPARTRVDWSDTHDKSPWSKKLILTLDGGGVKGLSSLLILKWLMYLIEQIEKGRRPKALVQGTETPEYYKPHPSSVYSPWIDGEAANVMEERKIDKEHETLEDSLAECFSSEENNKPNEKQGNQYKPCHYFDYIAGTSTGGLSAIMLSRLEMSVQDAIDQYNDFGKLIFAKPRFMHSKIRWLNYVQPKYSSKRTEAVFKEVILKNIAEELKRTNKKAEEAPFHQDPKRCRTIVVAFGPADDGRSVEHAYLFRTYDHHDPPSRTRNLYKRKHLNPGNAHADPIWQIARATSAAPKFFSKITFNDRTFRDGGMVANNPAELALEEVSQMHEQKPTMIVTIGTGRPKEKKTEPKKARKVSYIKDWSNVIKVMKNLITESQKIADRVEEKCADRSIDHYRWNVANGIGDMVLDEWTQDTKRNILDYTKQYLLKRKVHLRLLQCARILVRIRRERADTERWESFAQKSEYYCPDPHCEVGKVSKIFSTRDQLREHGIHEHGLISHVDVKNISTLHYTCVFGRCGIDRVFAFEQEKGLKEHLRDEHQITNPTFVTLERMEAWLDKRREPLGQAVLPRDSELRSQDDKFKAESTRQDGSRAVDNELLGANLNPEAHSRDGSNSSKPASVEGLSRDTEQNGRPGTTTDATMQSTKRIQTEPGPGSNMSAPTVRQRIRRCSSWFQSPIVLRSPLKPKG